MLLEEYIKGKNIHMLGIGGVSMSGIAVLLKNLGYNVTGTNNVESPTLDKLRNLNIRIFTPHFDEGLRKADMIVYTAAIKQDDPDMIKARELNIPLVERADFLGEITKAYSKTVAISGMHGKTTVTSMIAVTLLNANIDATTLVGGDVEQLGGNFKIGNSDILIAEACEYVESFTKLFPYIGIILNIEPEHLDYYRNLDHIKSAFTKFINKINPNGKLIVNIDDNNIKSILNNTDKKAITFSIETTNADWIAKNISYNVDGIPNFDVYYKNEFVTNIQLNIPGIHNIYNSLACIAACYELGISFDKIKQGLEFYQGTKRRFEYKGTFNNNIKVYDDYAHHPSEIKATLKALKNKEYNHSWCVFQPHTYSRTKTLFDDFKTSFSDCDNVIILDIYAAREKDTGIVNSAQLTDAINEVSGNAIYFDNFEKAQNYILNNVEDNDIVITMGAGEAYKIGENLVNN